jgi:GLPGLI family protein
LRQCEALYIAWYTEEIPLPHGPNIFGGLPGVILELISTKWQTVEIAIDIQTQHVEIVQPAVSKKVSREKFDKIKMDLRSRLPAIIIR